MVYQRRIPREELFYAQLEMLMQNGRTAGLAAQLAGLAAAVALFRAHGSGRLMLAGAAAFLLLQLLRSWHMGWALQEWRFRSRSRLIYWQLILGNALTGAIWSAAYIHAAEHTPVTLQYLLLLLIVVIAACSLAFSVAVREYFIAYVFASLWPIAWWCLVYFRAQPYNLHIGLMLLVFCALLLYVAQQTYIAFRNMISLAWEREHTARELGALTVSLRDRNRQLSEARRQLSGLANADELTGLANRRRLNRALREEIGRARRYGTDLSLILVDVDHFKEYNDTYGHPAGDSVLQAIGRILHEATSRAGEVAGRYGGEEFLLVLPGTPPAAALRMARRLQDMVRSAQLPHASSGTAAHVTISQGVVTTVPDGQQPSDIIRLADEALYRAKGAGRDSIAVAGLEASPPALHPVLRNSP